MHYTALPKVDLHCHLDGSARPETIYELALKDRVTESRSKEALINSLSVPEEC